MDKNYIKKDLDAYFKYFKRQCDRQEEETKTYASTVDGEIEYLMKTKKEKEEFKKNQKFYNLEKIQTEIMSRRKLFATNIWESDIQINEPEEVKEDPSCNAHMELSKYKRRRKCCKKNAGTVNQAAISKIDALT